VIVGVVLVAAVVAYVGRALLARRARHAFCEGDCVTLALRLKPGGRGLGWRHGYARLSPDLAYWRAEHKIRPGADLTLDRASIVVREHRPVRKGEAMVSEHCELVFARYQDEQIELAVLREDLDRLLSWLEGRRPAA
jgi:hypothetical protein